MEAKWDKHINKTASALKVFITLAKSSWTDGLLESWNQNQMQSLTKPGSPTEEKSGIPNFYTIVKGQTINKPSPTSTCKKLHEKITLAPSRAEGKSISSDGAPWISMIKSYYLRTPNKPSSYTLSLMKSREILLQVVVRRECKCLLGEFTVKIKEMTLPLRTHRNKRTKTVSKRF